MADTSKRFTWKRLAVACLAMLLVGWVALELTLRSDWFEEQLRLRVIAELKQATGGEAQLGLLRFNPSLMTVELEDLRLYGPGQEQPFVDIPRVSISISIESLLSRRIRLDHVALGQPRLRLQIAEDGSTNWPVRPEVVTGTNIVDVRLGRFDVIGASVVFNGEPYDFDFSAENVALSAKLNSEGCYGFVASVASLEGTPEGLYDGSSLSSETDLCGTRLVVREIEVATPTYGFWRGSGSAEPVTDPVVDFDFAFEGPLASFSTQLPEGWTLDGVATGSGTIARTPQQRISYSGALGSENIVIRGPIGATTEVRLSAEFIGDIDLLRVPNLTLALANGTIEGEASVSELRDNWNLVSTGRIEAVRVDLLARAITTVIPWATAASGTYGLTATANGHGLETELAFSDPGDGQLGGITGQADVEYSSQTMAWLLHELDIAVDGIHLTASGTAGTFGSTDLSLEVHTDTRADVETLLTVVDSGFLPLPITLEGPTDVAATVTSRASLTRLADLRIDADASTGAVELHGYRWQRVTTSLSLADGQLTVHDGRLVGRDGSVDISGQASIDVTRPPTEWPFSGRATVSGLDAAKLAPLAGLSTTTNPVAGTLDATADLQGPWEALSGNGEFAVRAGSLEGNPFDALGGTVAYDSGRASATNLTIRRGDSLIAGGGSYIVDQRAFSLVLEGSRLRLEEAPVFDDSQTSPSGLLAFNVNVDGVLAPDGSSDRFEALAVDGSWRVQGLTVTELELGDWSGEATSNDDSIELTLMGAPLGGSVSGVGEVGVTNLEFTSDIRFESLAFGSLLASEGAGEAGPTGVASGEAQFRGAFSSLSETSGEGSFNELRLAIVGVPGADAGYELYNPFPMRWKFSDGQLNLDHMRLQGIGTNVELTGAIGLAPDIDSDLRIDGDFDLIALQQLQPSLTTSGRSTIGVRLTGALSDPEIQGEWVIQEGVLQSEELPAGLSGINGRVLFVGREIRIEEMRALSGGGTLTLSGGGRLDPNDYEFRLDATAESVRVRYPVGITSLVDGAFVLSGGADQRLLSGEVIVQRLSTTRTTTLGSLLAELRPRTPTTSQDAPLDRVQVNIHVASAPGVEINTSLIRNVSAGIDLRLVGTLGNPSLLGQIDISQGQMTIHGSRYAINRGQIEFRNPVRIEPILDFEMETRMRGVDIALILAGPARRMNISYRSDPPLSFSELVNLVAVGRDPSADPLYSSQQRISQQSLFQTGANTVVANAVQSPVSPGLQRFFGVSRLKVDPGLGGVESNSAARISTEQPLANDVTLIYTYDLSSTQQQTLRLEWTPDRRWTFVVVRDENGLVGSDAIYKLRRP
jgi:translocation and assembly module TamB